MINSTGSNPGAGTFDDIAQLVERQAVNLLVVGSSPSIVAIYLMSVALNEKDQKSC